MAYKLKLNKKADVSITILVIGVFAVCTLAVISFLLAANGSQGNFANTEIFENLSSQAENFYFYVNSGLSPEEASQKTGAQIEGNNLILNAEEKDISVQYIIDLGK